ncbi:phage tail protein [Lactiplantibacillus plantarum]|uniref:phage tail protein n=1 Tax=Lactiplantibacillus plantarum TaxID=1590 RepID=UPI003EB87CBF
MIKFHDPAGTPHFGQATITRTTSVNGGLSLTGEVFAGDDVLNGLDYGWWLNFDNEKYVITYKKLSDDTNTVVFDAVQQFFWDFAKVALHAQYTGSHEYTFYLGQLFDKSGYTYKNDVTVPAFEKENWGYKNKLDLFNDIIDQAGVEFEVHNETVHIAKQIGSDLTSFARKGINLSNLTEEMKISDFATYAKGYGAFKDTEDQSKGRLEVEYRSELAKQFGDLEMDPIVDERYTIADNLIAALKKQVDATYAVSMTMNIYDLENAGYPNYEAPKVGDWILAIDEALNFKRKIRIIQLEEQFDVTGKRIGYTATCGDLSIVDQYTHLQSSLDSKVQRIQESVDNVAISANGKSSNYYGAKEPVSANEGDLWFDQSNSDPDKWSIKQWLNGRWEQITLNPGEVSDKVNAVKQEAETAVENAKSASDKADQLAAKYDDTNSLASQAFDRATSAQSDASSAVAQASSAAADSKDAKQIAGAVSQSYKTLTDGSTMTIAELENGLAAKLTKTDLNGYATETWTQNQIKVTADGINATMSSVKKTIDSQTTSINDLKADSSSFKSQFTTVNDTLGKQTTDIGSLQASSKELISGFNTLTTDNTTNKSDISQLKQTTTEVSSTLETVQTQVQNSAVGTNLLINTGDLSANWHGLSSISTIAEYNGHPSMVFTSSTQQLALQQLNSGKLKNSTQYTASFWAKADNAGDKAHTELWGSIGKTDFVLTTNWVRYTAVVTSYSDANTNINHSACYFGVPAGNKGNVYIALPKLELGITATDWCPNPDDNATVTAVSSISQTIEHIKTTVSGKVDGETYRSDMNELNNQITAKVSQVDVTNENILPYSGYWSDLTGWSLMSWGASDKTLSLVHHSFYHNAVDTLLCITTSQNVLTAARSLEFKLIPNTSYTFSFLGFASNNVVGSNVLVLGKSYESTNEYDFIHPLFSELKMSPSGINKYTATFTTDATETQAYVRIDNGGSNNGQSSGSYFAELKLERGKTATPYTRISSGEIQVTSDNINLKVSKDGVINAINVSNEGTSIYGSKLHITADTYIDNATIKSAMIDYIDAEKIKTGILDATNVKVVHLNADSITSGAIRGSNLLIDLDVGNVEFQKGRIHSADNTIDINIDAGYMSVANGSNRVMLKNGEMQFVQPGIYDTSTNPYLRISNTFGGQSTEGAAFIGRKYAVLTNSDNSTGNEMFDIGLGTEKFSGIATGYGTGVLNAGWHMTKVGGAERGVVISGGKATSYRQYWSASPSIMVGATQTSNSSGGMNGSNIIMDCDYLYNFSTWMRTSSHAANVYVADDGAIVRASSASKYKTNIERSFETEMGERILEVPTAHWFDKAEVLKKTLDPQAPDPRRYFGMIADDLDDAGLTELVEYNDRGEVEGLMYDRIALTIIPIVRNYRDRITKLESEIKQLKEG